MTSRSEITRLSVFKVGTSRIPPPVIFKVVGHKIVHVVKVDTLIKEEMTSVLMIVTDVRVERMFRLPGQTIVHVFRVVIFAVPDVKMEDVIIVEFKVETFRVFVVIVPEVIKEDVTSVENKVGVLIVPDVRMDDVIRVANKFAVLSVVDVIREDVRVTDVINEEE